MFSRRTLLHRDGSLINSPVSYNGVHFTFNSEHTIHFKIILNEMVHLCMQLFVHLEIFSFVIWYTEQPLEQEYKTKHK
jgi:hypothetical protein